jgi:hypothetical protein
MYTVQDCRFLCQLFEILGLQSVAERRKIHFRIGSHENKIKHLFYFDLGIILPIQIQLLENKSPNNDSPYLLT